MTQDARIIVMWRYGLDTDQIAHSLNALRKTKISEAKVHRIIRAERERRLGYAEEVAA